MTTHNHDVLMAINSRIINGRKNGAKQLNADYRALVKARDEILKLRGGLADFSAPTDQKDIQRLSALVRAQQITLEKLEQALETPVKEPVAVGSDWTRCMKLPVVVHVRQQRPGEAHVSTREGITPVRPDDLIMRGVSGEEYPIGRAIFEQTYTLHADKTAPLQVPVTWPQLSKNMEYAAQEEFHILPPRLQRLWKRMQELYIAPPAAQRQWVGLTDEERMEIYNNSLTIACCIDAVAAKLKGKNT